MSFTDDDLKRLKEDLGPANTGPNTDRWKALLARLDAESNCADLLEIHYDSGVFDDFDEGDVALIGQALEARRKAAGHE